MFTRADRTTRGGRPAGFTMVELIVVIGIIILAAGMMAPTITEFFKNRHLQQVMREFGGTINSARLRAVNERTRVHLVFFKEGIRVYDARENRFVDDLFDASASPFNDDKIWYVLGFQDRAFNMDLAGYEGWAKTHLPREGKDAKKKPVRRRRGPAPKEAPLNLDGLPQIVFQRDGSAEFKTGTDVMTELFRRDPPASGDIMVFSTGNTNGGFIDISNNGQSRSRLALLESEPETAEKMKESFAGEGSRKKKRRGRRRSS